MIPDASIDVWIAKYMGTGMTPAQVASKLGTTEEVVKSRYADMLDRMKDQAANGYSDLAEIWMRMSHQFASFGKSIESIALALGAQATPDDMRNAVLSVMEEEKKEYLSIKEALAIIDKKFIVLRKFVPPPVTIPDPPLSGTNNQN